MLKVLVLACCSFICGARGLCADNHFTGIGGDGHLTVNYRNDGVKGKCLSSDFNVMGAVFPGTPLLGLENEGTLSLYFKLNKKIHYSLLRPWKMKRGFFFAGTIGVAGTGLQHIENGFKAYIDINRKTGKQVLMVQTATSRETGNRIHYISGGAAVRDKVWHHLVISWKGSRVTVFLNGRNVGASRSFVCPDFSKIQFMRLGYVVPKFAMYGALDEFKIINKGSSKYSDIDGWLKNGSNNVFYASFDNTLKAVGSDRFDGDNVVAGRIAFPFERLNTAISQKEQNFKVYLANGSNKNLDYQLEAIFEPVKVKGMKFAGTLGARLVPVKVPLQGTALHGRINLINGKVVLPGNWLYRCHLRGRVGAYRINTENSPVAVSAPPLNIKKASAAASRVESCSRQQGLRYSPLSGIKMERLWLSWRIIEEKRGEFDWSLIDQYVKEAEMTGVELMPVVWKMPLWASTAPAKKPAKYAKMSQSDWDEIRSHKYLPHLQALTRFAFEMAKRYRGRIKYYEFWNEPNATFKGEPAGYAKALNAYIEGIKKGDPKAKVAGISGSPGFVGYTDNVLSVKELKQFDIHAGHYYFNSKDPTKAVPEKNLPLIKNLFKVLRSHKRDVPLWGTESGVGHAKRDLFKPLSEEEVVKRQAAGKQIRHAGGVSIVSEYRASVLKVRHWITLFANGVEKNFSWLPGTNRNFMDNIPYMPFISTVYCARLFYGTDRMAERIDLGDEDLYCYKFKKDKTEFYTFHANGKIGTVKLKISGPGHKVYATDHFGNSVPFVVKDGTAVVKVQEAPLFLFEAGSLKVDNALRVPSNLSIVIGENKRFAVTVCNEDAKLLDAVLALIPGDSGLQFNPSSVRLSLKPGSTRKVDFTLTLKQKVAAGNNQFRVRLTSRNETMSEKTVKFSVVKPGTILALPETSEQLVVDGQLSEWNGKKFIDFSSKENMVIGTLSEMEKVVFHEKERWKGKSDLDGRFALAFTDGAIYGAVRVRDDKLTPNPRRAFDGDSVELFIDGRSGESQGSSYTGKGCAQLFLAPLGKEGVVRKVGAGAAGAPDGAVYAWRKTAEGYDVEFRIPLDHRFFPAVNGEEKFRVGFDIGLNDCDTSQLQARDNRKVQMMWSGSGRNFADASGYGKLTLKRNLKNIIVNGDFSDEARKLRANGLYKYIGSNGSVSGKQMKKLKKDSIARFSVGIVRDKGPKHGNVLKVECQDDQLAKGKFPLGFVIYQKGIKKSGRYRLSFDLKTDLKPVDSSFVNAFTSDIHVMLAAGKHGPNLGRDADFVRNTTDWTRKTFIYELPPGTQQINIRFIMKGCTGSFSVDNIDFCKI